MNWIKSELEQMGFTTALLRRGVITALIAFMIALLTVFGYGMIYLYKAQVGLYERILVEVRHQVKEEVKPTIRKMNRSADRMDTAVNKIDVTVEKTANAADLVDSIGHALITQQKPHK